MNVLFVHQNFPGQYLHLARHLVTSGHNVRAISQSLHNSLVGITKTVYPPVRLSTQGPRNMRAFAAAVQNGEAVAEACIEIERDGFVPDIVLGHSGWGEILFIKDVWPSVPLLGYFEYYYRFDDSDVTFDSEFPPNDEDRRRIRILNTTSLLSLEATDWGHTPTHWQHSLYPASYRERISVLHEGVDSSRLRPNNEAALLLADGTVLSRSSEVITYSARNLEPYRGFHIFMRALPDILRRRPNARALIIGGDKVSYSRRPRDGGTYRERLMAEVGDGLDLSRVHFVGRLPFEQYLNALQISSVHVYLTYPFVLSWSLLEAMATACPLVCSRTAPVEEFIEDGVHAHLVDFFDIDALVETVDRVLRHPERERQRRVAARSLIEQRYDLRRVCLPQHLKLVEKLTGTGRPSMRGFAGTQNIG